MKRKNQIHKKRFDAVDVVVVVLLTLWMLLVIVPFVNAISISFATQKEYVDNPLMLFPSQPTLQSYKVLLNDYRIWVGFRTSFLLVVVGVPVSMLLTTMLAYGTSRGNYPGKKIIIGGILFTMLFNGGIIPLYLQMKEMGLTNTIWSVVLAGTVNVFYFVIMRNYFQSLPESLIESARLDGAGEWRILFDIILPLSKPIIATLTLFYLVDRWNEWYNALIFIRNTDLQPLQLVLRSIVMESSIEEGTKIHLGNIDVEVWELSGHTAHSVVFVDRSHKCIFTGDAIGSGYIVLLICSEEHAMETVEQYRESLMKITPRMSELKNFAWLGGHGIQENGCDPRHQQDYLAGESQYFNPIRQQVMLDMICLCNNLISGKISWKSVIDSPEHYCNTGSAGIFFHFI